MSTVPTRRFAGAATLTAVLAFMLVVPTILHLAVPAYGQGEGSNNGYGSTDNDDRDFVVGGSGTTETSVSTDTDGDGDADGGSEQGPPTFDLGGDTGTGETDAGSSDAGAGSETGAGTGGANSETDVDSDTSTDPDASAEEQPAPNVGASATVDLGAVEVGESVSATFTLPDPIEILEPTDVFGGTAPLSEDLVRDLLEQPKVSGVEIKSKVASENVKVVVKELLPTDSELDTVLAVPPTTPAANVVLKVASGATTTEFRALKILEIHADGLEKGEVESATVSFRVTQSELDALGLTTESITLLHLVDGKWVELPTTLVDSANGAFNFAAVTPSFSYFAVASKQAPAQESVVEQADTPLGTVALVLGAAVIAAVVVVAMRNRKA